MKTILVISISIGLGLIINAQVFWAGVNPLIFYLGITVFLLLFMTALSLFHNFLK